MKTYNTLQELVRRTRVRFAQKTEHGWVARRNAKNASHRLHYMFVYGQLDRNRVTLEAISLHDAEREVRRYGPRIEA